MRKRESPTTSLLKSSRRPRSDRAVRKQRACRERFEHALLHEFNSLRRLRDRRHRLQPREDCARVAYEIVALEIREAAFNFLERGGARSGLRVVHPHGVAGAREHDCPAATDQSGSDNRYGGAALDRHQMFTTFPSTLIA